ncbi:hypothetical protein WJX79_007704 [Trebouxia sp. C0005]
MELMSVEKFQQTADTAFTANLEAPSDSYEHKLMLKRLDHELHSRKQARQQLIRTEVVGSKEGAEVELAGDNKNALQPARKKQKRSASFVSTSDHDHYQAFPLAVKLHLLDLSHTITFTYLPSLGVVTAEAGDQPGNELLAALFKDDSGKDTPNTANKHLDDGSFVFDTKTTARPYRWAQWLAGLDFLPAIPAGLLVQGNVCQETLQDAVKSYSRERRAIHILTTLVKQAEDASELGQQLSELGKKRIPLHFPTRLFRHAPEASLQVWQEMPKQAWPASVAAVKPRPPSSASKPEVNVQDAEEDEEGELADAPQASTDNVKAEEDAMEIDPDSAGQNGFREGSGQGQVPEPLTQADGEGHISWGKAAPGSTFTMYKMMIKSSNGWQLDGHVQIYSSYPAVAPQVVVTAIKEGYLPARHVKAGRPQRQELSHQEVTAVQEQVNRDLLSKLIEDEQSHRYNIAAGLLKPVAARGLFSRTECSAEHDISIDTSALSRPQTHNHGKLPGKEQETEMAKHIKGIIRFRGGPITLAEYMSEVLTNPQAGYYINRDVFGTDGDFTTSPEISQLFGEMIGIWCLTVWQQLGSPSKMRLVELGPGRGTLMADLLRGTAPFKPFISGLDVHLVEVSKFLRLQQWDKLHCRGLPAVAASTAEGHQTGTAMPSGVQVHWHRSLDEIPDDLPTVYIAHEFLDALPVHQFQKTERGWCERLIDVASDESPLHFRLVLSPRPTPASKLLVERRLRALPFDQKAAMKGLEVSPQAMSTAGDLAKRVATHGGAALLIDYGRNIPYPTSLQAIREHQFCGLLEQPGKADLSAHVDFGAIRQGVRESQAAATQKGEQQDQDAQPVQEGMGLTYQAMAITSEDAPVPVAF